jgi:hypothetical protein
MRIASILLCAAAFAAVATVPASAASPRASVKLTACQTGDEPTERLATYQGRMKHVPGAVRMWMRFTLFERVGDEQPVVVAAPGLRVWRKSRTGVRKFVYSQTVAGLGVGGQYSALVRYRWYDAKGRLIRTARHTSKECLVAGDLPNLRLVDVRGVAAATPGTETYSVDVTNTGRVAAGGTRVHLFVDGIAADSETIDGLAPGETKTVRMNGPACTARIRAVVDRDDDVRETTEADNTLRSSCPSAAGAPGV